MKLVEPGVLILWQCFKDSVLQASLTSFGCKWVGEARVNYGGGMRS